jgi:K+/H+ antiporter YhaU regulatory subunit KhtT
MSRSTNDGLRVDRLPRVGLRYQVGTTDGQRLTVVIDRKGDRHISLSSGRQVEDHGASAVLSARQSSLLALILTDTLEIADAGLHDVSMSPEVDSRVALSAASAGPGD